MRNLKEMKTAYYQLAILSGVMDSEGYSVEYTEKYRVLEIGSKEVCYREEVKLTTGMRKLMHAGLLKKSFVDNVESNLHIINQ